jgi:TonB family protein
MRHKFATPLGISAIGHLTLVFTIFLFFDSHKANLPASPVWISVDPAYPASPIPTHQLKKRPKVSATSERTFEGEATVSTKESISASNVATYQNRIRAMLEERLRYPELAKRLRQEGEVVLAMEVEQSGKVLWSKLASPSPFSSLNASALESVSKIDRFPPLPEGKTSLVLEIPLIFAL